MNARGARRRDDEGVRSVVAVSRRRKRGASSLPRDGPKWGKNGVVKTLRAVGL